MERLWAPWRIEYIRREGSGCFLCEVLKKKKNETETLIIEKGAKAFTIMNRYPYNNGHLMIVPIRHLSSVEYLDDEEILEIHRLLNRAIKAINWTMKPQGFNIGINQGQIAGAGVAGHIHLHLVPRWQGDTNFMPIISNIKVVSEALQETYKKIKEGLSRLDNP